MRGIHWRVFMHRICLAALVALCASSAMAMDAPATANHSAAALRGAPPLADFLKRDAFGTMKISPTGEYLAATVPLSDRTSLIILRRSDLKLTGHVTLSEHSHVEDFDWVNDKRVLFSIGQRFGWLDAPQLTGEIFGVNADGTGQGRPVEYGFLFDTLRNDDDHVLIANGYQVEKMNVVSGDSVEIARAPSHTDGVDFLVDQNDVPRFAWGHDGSDRRIKTFYRADAKSPWELINDESKTDRKVEPEGFSADGKTAYLQVEESNAADSIHAFDTTTRQREIVYRDDNTSPSNYLRSPEDGSVYAAVFEDGKPRVEYLDPENAYAKQLRAIQANFKDAMVVPTSYSKDGSLALYVVYSERIPSDYYLFDRKANRVTYIASNANWFKPEMLSEMRPISLKARDGLPLEGFLTIPRGSNGKNLPLVIHPHGGPFDVYDQWGYDPEVQLLASRGYAVLQVNFRGSGNYGRAFEHAGYKQWGGAMQDDLTDATRWAIAQGIADPDRICIYGASYGAYAALMGVVKEPSLYRCAIGYVGVYDMDLMFHGGDIHQSMYGYKFLKETLGDQNLKAISPTNLADRITVPVMLVAGREDRRAPFKHTNLMRDALQQAHKQVDAKVYDGEGHGFYDDAHRTDLYTRMLAFLNRNIGDRTSSHAAAAPAGDAGGH
jgi:dipeptidyl aminopeptidase/acylaminoacyl peptidase